MEIDSIRVRVRQVLGAGALPCDDQGKVWAGRGHRHPLIWREECDSPLAR